MFLGNLPGIERVMFNDVQPPYISLITGPPGALKTGTALTIVSNYLRQTGEFGLYCTIEETVDSLMRGASSLGLSLPQNLQITDFTELRRDNDAMDYLKFTRRMIEHFKRERLSLIHI